MDLPIGRILKGVGGLYLVRDENGAEWPCKARGKFRKLKLTPLAGDFVRFIPPTEGSDGYLTEILERRNECARPPVANIDRLVIVVAATQPEPDWQLVDKLLVDAHAQGIDSVIAVNKADLRHETIAQAREDYAAYPCYEVSAATGEGIDALREALISGVACVAGQSGVGKSSILGRLLGIDLAVGEVSRTDRGRHTTRHVELHVAGDALIADTPGFSLIDNSLRDPVNLQESWPEFTPFSSECRFNGCQHIGEPDCAVERAANANLISRRRLDRYRVLHADMRERWSGRW